MTEDKEPLWELFITRQDDNELTFFLEQDGDEVLQGKADTLKGVIALALNALEQSGLEELAGDEL
jgi:hypothetical protein